MRRGYRPDELPFINPTGQLLCPYWCIRDNNNPDWCGSDDYWEEFVETYDLLQRLWNTSKEGRGEAFCQQWNLWLAYEGFADGMRELAREFDRNGNALKYGCAFMGNPRLAEYWYARAADAEKNAERRLKHGAKPYRPA